MNRFSQKVIIDLVENDTTKIDALKILSSMKYFQKRAEDK